MESGAQQDGTAGSQTIKPGGPGREAANEADRNEQFARTESTEGGTGDEGRMQETKGFEEQERKQRQREIEESRIQVPDAADAERGHGSTGDAAGGTSAGSATNPEGAQGFESAGREDGAGFPGGSRQRKWSASRFDRGDNRGVGPGSGNQGRDLFPRDALQMLLGDPIRMMQAFMRFPFGGSSDTDRWFGDFRPANVQPQIDVVDTGDAVSVSAELPGVRKEDVEVVVEGDNLVLRGEKRCESEVNEAGCYRIERAFGHFERRIPLPENIDPQQAQASFDNAVLTVRLPKTQQQMRSRRIDIA